VFRLHVRGLEHVPREGGFVLAANHLSNFDPWPLALALYPRQLHFMAKAELYTPVLKQVLHACGAFPVRRGDPSGSAFRAAVALAREGGAVAMFPEGTRRAKGLRKKHRPKPHVGAARIALAAGVPLVPAAVAGTDKLSRFGPIRVVFGPPFQLSANGSRRRAGAAATVELLARIAELERAL
jgi:1-acyl-sn-glycerol-3-phosphate acyltransferase